MRTVVISFVASLSFALLPVAAALGSPGDPKSDCGRPSDIHDGWRIASPEEQGFDPAVLCAMDQGVEDGKLPNIDSIVIVRHGALVYERYFSYPHRLHYEANLTHEGNSMTKSVVSLLAGIALDRGLIKDLDATVFSFFPEYADLRTPEKDRITLRHLLTMSAGFNASVSRQMLGRDRDPIRHAFEGPLAREPGVSFEYSNVETELVGAILQKTSGKTVEVLANEDIFSPLGIHDVDWFGRLGNGLPMSSTGLSLRARDWAKIGQLVLNRGLWDGKQIVPSSWIVQSTTEQVKAPKGFTYGFQWWLSRSSSNGRVVAWAAALGFNAQKLIVIPELDAVVVFNAAQESVRMVAPEIVLLDQYILPAMLKP